MAVNADVYLDIIKRGLVPFIGKYHLNNDYKFWPDLTSSHYANKAVDYYQAQSINFGYNCVSVAYFYYFK